VPVGVADWGCGRWTCVDAVLVWCTSSGDDGQSEATIVEWAYVIAEPSTAAVE
jgi:hypothetical protein